MTIRYTNSLSIQFIRFTVNSAEPKFFGPPGILCECSWRISVWLHRWAMFMYCYA